MVPPCGLDDGCPAVSVLLGWRELTGPEPKGQDGERDHHAPEAAAALTCRA